LRDKPHIGPVSNDRFRRMRVRARTALRRRWEL
jgi:hypothetical protein